jgi:hypothetical protein
VSNDVQFAILQPRSSHLSPTKMTPQPSSEATLATLTKQLSAGNNAYNPSLYLDRARAYIDLDYPDLAAGDAYRAVLLTDYVRDYSDEGELELDEVPNDEGSASKDGEDEDEEDDDDEEERFDFEEFHAATEALSHLRASGSPTTLLPALEESALHLLVQSLQRVGCISEATDYARLGVRRFPTSAHFSPLLDQLTAALSSSAGGKARRFVYPWNKHEPDRFSSATLEYLNTHVVPRSSSSVEVRVVNLPLLSETAEVLGETKHLGVFATRDIAVGELCMQEESALTVVTDPAEGGLCEYCGTRWRRAPQPSRPRLKIPGSSAAPEQEEEEEQSLKETFTCESCVDAEAEGIEAVVPVWCSAQCRDKAMAKYHPAFCRRPIAPLHRAALDKAVGHVTTPSQPGGAVYALLLLKTFAMALTQGIHPLELEETKYLYGVPPVEEGDLRIGWGWEENVRGAVGILEALGVDVFSGKHPRLAQGLAGPEWWSTWVVNTLIAKFRGVASGRQNSRGETEAAAAHTLYSLVNHDCEPSVRWECAGIMKFWGVGKEADGVAVRKGEELHSCYCDNTLSVRERREWMMGCLGGACMCQRCLREEKEEAEKK